MDLGLRDRVCVITGSTAGIGRETARLLAEEGARVVTSGRGEAPGVGEILHVTADLSRPGEPERVAGFGILAGRILPELEPQVASPSRLAGLRGYVAHGHLDEKLPVDWAHRASAGLSRWGVPHALHLYPAGHALTPAMQADFIAWLDDPAASWNRRACRSAVADR